MHALLAKELRIAVRRIALHSVIHNIVRLSNSIAPEWLRLDMKVLYSAVADLEQGEREGATVSVLTRDIRKVVPPSLSVAIDTTCRSVSQVI